MHANLWGSVLLVLQLSIGYIYVYLVEDEARVKYCSNQCCVVIFNEGYIPNGAHFLLCGINEF